MPPVMTDEGRSDVDFRFRLSPAEMDVIEHAPHPPQSLILLGRSGTGKTTCAVFRMFARWRAAFEEGRPLHQVFVTVSATLKEQVSWCVCVCVFWGGRVCGCWCCGCGKVPG
jgi:hypothetical protein